MSSSAGWLAAAAIGVGATLTMDLWNLFLRKAFGIQSLNFCFLGRWVAHMPTGRFRHRNIGLAEEKPAECVLGWVSHYSIGIALALGFIGMTSGRWLEQPTLAPALLYGIGTVVLPYFVMQPSLGLGIAAARTPNPFHARLKSLATHTTYGLGLYGCALVVSAWRSA